MGLQPKLTVSSELSRKGLLFALMLTASSCGGGGGAPADPPPPPDVTVRISRAYDSEDAVRSLSMVFLEGAASSLSPGPLELEWSQISGPTVAFQDKGGPALVLFAPEVDSASTVRMRLSAHDRHRQYGSGEVSFVLSPLGRIPENLASPYALDSSPSGLLANTSLDSAGVIRDPFGRGTGYHPGVVARYATALYRRWLSSGSEDTDALQRALINSDWLVDNLHVDSGVGRWRHTWPHPPYTDDPGWASGMSNAIALAALVQLAPHADRQREYAAAIQHGLNAFELDVMEGGLCTAVGNGGRWFEEVAVASRAGHLNGMLFALAALHVAWTQGEYPQAGDAFADGLDAVRERLPQYDDGFTSLYHLMPRENGEPRRTHGMYNWIHVKQLLWLYGVTRDEIFLRFAHRFLTYENKLIEAAGLVMTQQNQSEVPLPEEPGLIDGSKFENEACLQGDSLQVTLQLSRAVSPTRLVLFVPGIRDALPDIVVDLPGGNHQSILVPATLDATHRTPATNTSVFVYPLPENIVATDTLRFRIQNSLATKKVCLREVALHWEDDYQFVSDVYRDFQAAYGWPPLPARPLK